MKKSLLILLAVPLALIPFSCSATSERRDPTGERFPTVTGETLEKQEITLPDHVAGAPALLIIGYERNTQFDVDRWLLGLHQAGLAVRVYEVPTIPGALAGVASGWIDNGMRRGIPEEDWKLVVTLYRDAKPVVRFTGNENPMPARVLLLDRDGIVRWFHDRGYSVSSLVRLEAAWNALTRDAPRPNPR